ncbi:hypothetical protein BLNAU_7901 [Blattamonas nauphoetae]|uniref:Uncharacterized protein n=1 Tax=Blattamonas nauphoetae TaxID=2049346 RepID=A0ABQ9XZZ7_9EUKA|nr:hypothetical protein BLNAU_7901 [Blattamonas nauphoetae]
MHQPPISSFTFPQDQPSSNTLHSSSLPMSDSLSVFSTPLQGTQSVSRSNIASLQRTIAAPFQEKEELLQKMIKEKDEEIEDIKTMFNELNEDYALLLQTAKDTSSGSAIVNAITEQTQLEKDLQQSREIEQQLRQFMEEFQTQISEAMESVQQKELELFQLQNNVNDLQQKTADIEADCGVKTNTIQTLNIKRQKIEQDTKEKEKSIKSLQKELESIQDSNADLEAQLVECEEENEELKEEIEHHRDQIAEADSASAELLKLRSEVEVEKQTAVTKDVARQQLENEFNRLSMSLQVVEERIKKAEEKEQDAQSLIRKNTLEIQRAYANQKQAVLDEKLALDEVQRTQSAINEMQLQHKHQLQRILAESSQSLSAELFPLQMKLKQKHLQIGQLNTRLTKIKQLNQSLRDELDASSVHVSYDSEQISQTAQSPAISSSDAKLIAQQEAMIKQLKSDIESATTELSELNQTRAEETASYEETTQKLKEEIDSLKSQIGKERKTATRLREQMEQAERDNTSQIEKEARRSAKKMLAKIETDYRQNVAELQKEINSLIDTLRKENDESSRMLTEQKSSIATMCVHFHIIPSAWKTPHKS